MKRVPVLEQRMNQFRIMISVQSTNLTPEQFFRLCGDNPELRLELTARKEILIISPTNSKTGWRNAELTRQLANWAKGNRTGLTFDSNTAFTLPNGAVRSPDASWLRRERWDALTEEQQNVFAPICPDFVVELRSPGDSLSDVHAKLSEYIENGAQLGWLLDPLDRRVYIYRPGFSPQCLENPATINADPVLPGFVLDLTDIV